VDVTITNDDETSFAGQVTVTMLDSTWSARVDVASGGTTILSGELSLDDVPYWSPQNPHLAQAQVELCSGSDIVDNQVCQVGVRRITVDGTRVLLNGEAVRLHGFNRHEEYPTTGRSHDETMLWEDLRTIKASGANFVRACHYPQHRRFYDACDQLGLMVMDEIPLWGWGRGMAADGGTAPAGAAHLQLEEMIRRDRNRTCVVIWSVSNETGGGQPDVDAANVSLIRRVRELDPSRLVTHVMLHSVWTAADDPAMKEDDLLCLNEYIGSLHHEPPVHRREDLEAVKELLGRQLDELHQRFPDKPVLVTEYGGIGLPGHHGDFLWSEEFYGETIRAHWETFTAKPWVVGGLLWSWQDYPLHPNRQRWYPLGYYGVYTEDRRPKAAAATMAELFTAEKTRQVLKPTPSNDADRESVDKQVI
jgi:beta-glucuronidase